VSDLGKSCAVNSIIYQRNVKYQDIDIDSLRPDKSYNYLIDNRNASLTELLSDKKRLKEYLKERDCPVCGNEKYFHEALKDSLNLVKCNNCTTIYVNPAFDEAKYKEIYKTKHYQDIVKMLGESSHEYRKKRFGAERMDCIEKYHNTDLPKSYCDVGCSTGFVVEEAQDRGWKALGLELNPSAAAFGQKKGNNIKQVTLEQLDECIKFSAISFYDVLEHILYPADALKSAYAHLNNGGNIYIYVPNYNSASRLLLGIEGAHFIWPTHHLTYFTPDTLCELLERTGFKVFKWETQGLDIHDWVWHLKEKTNYDVSVLENKIELLQFYINSAGHGKNLRMYAKKK